MAFALTTSVSLVIPNAAAIENVMTTEAAPVAQTFEVTGTVEAVPIVRDGYGVTAPPPPPPPPPAVQWPLSPSTVMSSDFGPRSCAGCSSNHQGLDLNPGGGTPIGAMAAGVVAKASAGASGAFGVHVVIEHVIDGQKVNSLYAHMQAGSMPLAVGQTVSVGQTVGAVGCTGSCTGDHLHFEIHPGGGAPVDPAAWLRSRGV
jgi:murein DD-endopeptidase MepM/ murein hydrolase activator NlpD